MTPERKAHENSETQQVNSAALRGEIQRMEQEGAIENVSSNTKPLWQACEHVLQSEGVTRRQIISHNLQLWKVCNELLERSANRGDGAQCIETTVHAPSDAHDGFRDVRQMDITEWYQTLDHGDSYVEDDVPSLEYHYSDYSMSEYTSTTEEETLSGTSMSVHSDHSSVENILDGERSGVPDGEPAGQPRVLIEMPPLLRRERGDDRRVGVVRRHRRLGSRRHGGEVGAHHLQQVLIADINRAARGLFQVLREDTMVSSI